MFFVSRENPSAHYLFGKVQSRKARLLSVKTNSGADAMRNSCLSTSFFILLANGANIRITDKDGDTVLNFTEMNGHQEAAKILKEDYYPKGNKSLSSK